jgi:hypothetical protein
MFLLVFQVFELAKLIVMSKTTLQRFDVEHRIGKEDG